MDKILRPHQEYAAAYLDDIVVHSADWSSHLKRLNAVLNALWEAGLTANPTKCKLGLEEAEYLGFTIGRGNVRPQKRKTDTISQWLRPVTKKQVKTFLGLVGYYWQFIPNFATLAAPLHDLTKNHLSHQVVWSAEAEMAFSSLKLTLGGNPVVTLGFQRPFIVRTDASETGLGAVLSQLRNGKEHPITFISCKLLKHEHNYSTVEKEGLAIKCSLEKM